MVKATAGLKKGGDQATAHSGKGAGEGGAWSVEAGSQRAHRTK